jgi:hypothetical protein
LLNWESSSYFGFTHNSRSKAAISFHNVLKFPSRLRTADRETLLNRAWISLACIAGTGYAQNPATLQAEIQIAL